MDINDVPRHRVLLPTGRTLKPTATFFDLPKKHGEGDTMPRVDKATVKDGVGLSSRSQTKIAVILVTPSPGDEFTAQFLISSQKIRALLMDAIRWYLPTTSEDEMLLAWTSRETPLHLEHIRVQLPRELSSIEELAAVVPRSSAREDHTEAYPIVGWLAVGVAGIAVIISLYHRCKNLFV